MNRELSVIQHLDELRRRILICLSAVVITTLLSFPFSKNILQILKIPAPGIDALVFFGPEEALSILMRISIFSGIVLASPVLSYQLWLFVSPAVDEKLKRYSLFFVISVFIVFILGSLFAYFILLPRALVFLLSLQSQELKAMISASRYISFVSNIILATGLVFQMPVLIFLLSKAGLINAGILRKNFKFALVAIIVIAAIITPTTDIFNMLMLALPMLLLYEVSIWVAFFCKTPKKMMPLFLDSLMHKRISRKGFIKSFFVFLAAMPFSGALVQSVFAESPSFNGRLKRKIKGNYDLVDVQGQDPYSLTVKAVEAMGGMEKFVKKNSTVVIKPNMAWDRTPQQAGNTNPLVVAALVELCFKAGARRVNVFDVPCNDARRCYANSGIQKAAEAKGAKVYFANDWDVVKAKFGHISPMQGWPILRDALDCDTFINVPILKHHGLTRLTLSMKNLMGVCTGIRGIIHQDIGHKLVDLTAFINPELTVIDAYRVLMRNGPSGGNLSDVEYKYKVLVSTDPSLADIYACGIVNVNPYDVSYLKYAIDSGFGITDIKNANIHLLKA